MKLNFVSVPQALHSPGGHDHDQKDHAPKGRKWSDLSPGEKAIVSHAEMKIRQGLATSLDDLMEEERAALASMSKDARERLFSKVTYKQVGRERPEWLLGDVVGEKVADDIVRGRITEVGRKEFGTGYWYNAKTDKMFEIDSDALGPHGDHDGWIAIGDNAEKLGVDKRRAAALQAANWGEVVSEDHPLAKYADSFTGDAGKKVFFLHGESVSFNHGEEARREWEGWFKEKYGMDTFEASTQQFDELVRVRVWPDRSVSVSGSDYRGVFKSMPVIMQRLDADIKLDDIANNKLYLDVEGGFSMKVKDAMLIDRSTRLDDLKGNHFPGGKDHDQSSHGHDHSKLSDADRAAFLEAGRRGIPVPPNWHDIYLPPEGQEGKINGLLARGRDAKNRQVSLRTKEYIDAQIRAKHDRLQGFYANYDNVVETLRANMDTDAGKALYLISQTGFRIGGGTKDANTGATTLLGKHVKVEGDKAIFDFVGKHHVAQHHEVTDPLIVGFVRERAGRAGLLFDTTDEAVREHWKSLGGTKVHDFRSAIATRTAKAVVTAASKPRTKAEARALIKQAAEAAAFKLGNKPAESLKTYTDPRVFDEIFGG